MEMIPRHIWNKNGRSLGGEPLVFSLLSQINLSKKTLGLHSLNLLGNHRQRAFEIDFLILTERAVLGLEIKAGRVSCKDGSWRIHQADGVVRYSKSISPYTQAANGLHKLRSEWVPLTFGDNSDFSKIPFIPFAVLCKNSKPDTDFDNPAEMPVDFILWQEDLEAERFKERLNQGIDLYISTISGNRAGTLSETQVAEFSKKLRPELDMTYPSRSELDALEMQQKKLTEEQYQVIDLFKNMDRLVLDGGAGTGKTFALLYGARQEFEFGNKVAVVTDSEQLRKFIEKALGDTDVSVFSISMLKSIPSSSVELVFIDEGQDLCTEDDVAEIDRVLVNGMEQGRWRWFGDFENQLNPAKTFNPDVLDMLVSLTGNRAQIPLTRNVRNTPNIVTWLEHYCSARLGKTTFKGSGPEVKIVSIEQSEDWLTPDGYRRDFGSLPKSEVVLLVPARTDVTKQSVFKLARTGFQTNLIEDFKGMESKAVVISGLDDVSINNLPDLLYKSVSRSTGYVFIVASPEIKKAILNLSGGIDV